MQLTRNLAHVPGDSAVNHLGSYSALRVYVTSILKHPPTYLSPHWMSDPSVVSFSLPHSPWWRFIRIAFINIHVTHRQSLLIITGPHTRLIKTLLFRCAFLSLSPFIHFSSDFHLSILTAPPFVDFYHTVIWYSNAVKLVNSVIFENSLEKRKYVFLGGFEKFIV